MYVEDLITAVAESSKAYKLEADDYTFLQSIAAQVKAEKSLTSRQGFACIKVLSKYAVESNMLIGMPMRDFKACLASKMFRKELRITVQKRTEARYFGDNLVGFTYQYGKDIASDAQRLRAMWRNGIQFVSVTRDNIEKIIDFLGCHNFEIDTLLEEYLALCLSSKNQMSHFIADDGGVVANICDSDAIAAFLLHVVGAQRI